MLRSRKEVQEKVRNGQKWDPYRDGLESAPDAEDASAEALLYQTRTSYG
jgi:hypothetical protein